jgi:NTP pyrophosphatase (non-canonical NTP hydrolase)
MSDQHTPRDTATDSTGPTSGGEPTAADLWESIDRLWSWLDGHGDSGGREDLLLRMLKLSEEVGEVAQAVIGATGHNPRKGVSHSWDDVRSELCDVVITALVALRTLTPETREVFMAHLRRVTDRTFTPGALPAQSS